MKRLLRQIVIIAGVLAIGVSGYTTTVKAASESERELINLNAATWSLNIAASCGEALPGSDVLDGYKLPATKGFTAKESPINEEGIATELGTHVAFSHLASNNKYGDGGASIRDYAINMRWTYAKWYWDGQRTEMVDPEQRRWFDEEPRLLRVSNPRTQKSVIVAALEAGPAPWAGIDSSLNSEPKQGWQEPQLGTPPEYRGRVSGLTPKAMEAIGAVTSTNSGETGDELLYEWAPDQNAKPGTIGVATAAGDPSTAGNGSVCGDVPISAEGYAFPARLTKETADNGWYGSKPYWPCKTWCHHDETPAFDISHTDRRTINEEASEGIEVLAIYGGEIKMFNTAYAGQQGCYAFQLAGDDGWMYWYGHLRAHPDVDLRNGLRVEVGKPIAQIGERRCTGNGSYPHLHIDRGSPKGSHGGGVVLDDGSVCCRDWGFVPLINGLYETLQ